MIEVEVKITLKDPDGFRRKICKKGAIKVLSEVEEDIYFTHPHINLQLTDEALRLRRVNGNFYLTYKGPKMNKQSKTRQEFNVKVDDGEQIKQLLEKLGFQPFRKIIKTRTEYQLGKIKVYIDRVEGLGDYAEFEVLVDGEDKVTVEKAKIQDLMRSLGLKPDQGIIKSYLELLIDKAGQ